MAWTLLSVIFFLMSIDGAVSFHEISVKPLRNAFSLSGIFYYSWVVLAIPIVAAVGLYFLPFLFRLPKHVAIGFIASGSLFVGGALGTEFLCGYLATSSGLDSVAYKIAAASEEALEATGITLFISILIGHLAKNYLKLYMNSQY
jgi:hypothetical protein